MKRTIFLILAILFIGLVAWWFGFKKTPAIDTTALVEFQLSRIEKIGFPKKPANLSREKESLIVDIFIFQAGLIKDLGISSATTMKSQIISDTSRFSRIEQKKAEFWSSLKAKYPKLKLAKYSPRKYAHFMAWDLPSLLAPSGVFAKNYQMPTADFGSDHFLAAELLVGFFKVTRIQSDTVSMWNKQTKRDILFVDSMNIQGKNLGYDWMTNTEGQTFYQNIVLYLGAQKEHLKELVLTEEEKNILKAARRYQEVDIWRSTEASLDQETAAYKFAAIRMFDRSHSPMSTLSEFTKTNLAHETSHLVDQSDKLYRSMFAPKITQSPKEYFGYNANIGVHEEINGILGELVSGPRKDATMSKLLLSGGDGHDYAHGTAAKWVLDHILERIVVVPERYGVSFRDCNISLDNQAVLLLLDLQPRAIEIMAEDLRKIHRQNYDEDFSKDYLERLTDSGKG